MDIFLVGLCAKRELYEITLGFATLSLNHADCKAVGTGRLELVKEDESSVYSLLQLFA